MNVEKLAKLLMLTQSSNEHEALSAIKMANNLVKKAGVDWFKILTGGVVESAGSGSSWSGNFEVEKMFRHIYENAWVNFSFTFIDSLQQQFETTGRLSPKQMAALRKIYEKMNGSKK